MVSVEIDGDVLEGFEGADDAFDADLGGVLDATCPVWCVKRLRVVVLMVVGCRGCRCGSWRAGSGCGGGPGRGRPGLKRFVLVAFALVVGLRGGGAERSEATAEGSMARLSLLLPPWETCSPLIEEPDLLVTGARPA